MEETIIRDTTKRVMGGYRYECWWVYHWRVRSFVADNHRWTHTHSNIFIHINQ